MDQEGATKGTKGTKWGLSLVRHERGTSGGNQFKGKKWGLVVGVVREIVSEPQKARVGTTSDRKKRGRS